MNQIVSVIVAALTSAVQGFFNNAHQWFENLDHLATGAGIITTGVWALWARRVFSPHVDFAVSGRVFGSLGQQYVVPRISIKNLGNTRVTQLRQEGSGYRVWYAVSQTEKPFEPVQWSEPVFVQSIFEHHHWLEPGETISDEEHLIPLPSNWIAAKIEARQCVEIRGLFSGERTIEINTTAIVYPQNEVQSIGEKGKQSAGSKAET